jgi:hypothetical protein
VSDFYDRIHLSSSSTSADPAAPSGSNAVTVGEPGAEGPAPQVITTTVSAFAQAFVREVPLPDTSDEWMESKNAKSAAFKKVVATYKSNIASHENDGAEEGDEPPGPGPDAEEAFKSDDDALMYTASTVAPATSGSTLRGNKFSQFSLASNSSNNDWLDDDPTPSQKAASKNAYLRQFEKATTAYADASPPHSALSKTVVPVRATTEQPVATAPSSSSASACAGQVNGHDARLPQPPASAVKQEPVAVRSEPFPASNSYYSSAPPAASAVAGTSSSYGAAKAQSLPRAPAPGQQQPASLLQILAPYGAGVIKPEPSAHAPLEQPRGGVAGHAQWSTVKQEAAPTASIPPQVVPQGAPSAPAAGGANYLPPDVQR